MAGAVTLYNASMALPTQQGTMCRVDPTQVHSGSRYHGMFMNDVTFQRFLGHNGLTSKVLRVMAEDIYDRFETQGYISDAKTPSRYPEGFTLKRFSPPYTTRSTISDHFFDYILGEKFRFRMNTLFAFPQLTLSKEEILDYITSEYILFALERDFCQGPVYADLEDVTVAGITYTKSDIQTIRASTEERSDRLCKHTPIHYDSEVAYDFSTGLTDRRQRHDLAMRGSAKQTSEGVLFDAKTPVGLISSVVSSKWSIPPNLNFKESFSIFMTFTPYGQPEEGVGQLVGVSDPAREGAFNWFVFLDNYHHIGFEMVPSDDSGVSFTHRSARSHKTLPLNQSVTLALTFSQKKLGIYSNGQLDAEHDMSAHIHQSTDGRLVVGHLKGTPNWGGFSGLMKHLAFFREGYSADLVKAYTNYLRCQSGESPVSS